MRFRKLWLDTVFSPIISIILYLAVFGIVVGTRTIGDINFLSFIYTGLLCMLMVNSSFANPSFALIISKNVGTIADLQVVPIPPWGIGVAYAAAALTRAIATLVFTVLLTIWFIPLDSVHHITVAILAAILTGLEFGLLGVIFGMWAKNFEALTFITTFIMQPMIFLAGVFFPISTLPGIWSTLGLLNPLHHNVNLFRYGITGYADVSPLTSCIAIVSISLILFIWMQIQTKRSLKN
ncbi:ABC transporter permease [Candidatus Uhrbacteria bacterium]|nr:ABC transporter permease [Candidatus Uhrbacteria bacterium]